MAGGDGGAGAHFRHAAPCGNGKRFYGAGTGLRVRYGTPMRFDEFAGKERDKEVLDEVTGRIMAAITKLRG